MMPHKSGETTVIDNVAYYSTKQKKVIMGNITHRYKDLDIIPSAYQEGILDEFSNDVTLAGGSSTALMTESASKIYTVAEIGSAGDPTESDIYLRKSLN